MNIDQIDKDHQEVVRLLNLLANCGAGTCGNNENSEEYNSLELNNLLSCYDNFISYTRLHFAKEVEFMESINYPYFHNHIREHAVQMAAFTAFRSQLSNRGIEKFQREDLNWIKMWFLDHVFGEDQEYADFYHKSKEWSS